MGRVVAVGEEGGKMFMDDVEFIEPFASVPDVLVHLLNETGGQSGGYIIDVCKAAGASVKEDDASTT